MMLLAYIASCVALAVAFVLLKVKHLTRSMVRQMLESFAIIRDPNLRDEQKEQALRANLPRLIGTTSLVSLTALLTLLAGAVPVWIAVAMDIFTLPGFLYFAIRPDVILGTVVTLVAIPLVARQIRSGQ